jgi:hypothetical protein
MFTQRCPAWHSLSLTHDSHTDAEPGRVFVQVRVAGLQERGPLQPTSRLLFSSASYIACVSPSGAMRQSTQLP